MYQLRYARRLGNILGLIIFGFLLAAPPAALGATLLIDFETPETGSNLLIEPLSTPFGTVTVTNATEIAFTPLITPMNPTHWLGHDPFFNPGFAHIIFSFDVSSITFDYTGFGAGDFLAQVLDANGNVINSFFDPATRDEPEWVFGITLMGQGIREFRFHGDDPEIALGDQSGVDNLLLTVSPPSVIPEPATLALLSLCLAGLGFSRRQKAHRNPV